MVEEFNSLIEDNREMIHSSSTNDIYSIGGNGIVGNLNLGGDNNNRSNSTGSQTLPVMLMMGGITTTMNNHYYNTNSNNTSASGSGSLSPSSSVHNFSLLNDIYFHNSNDVNEILARGSSFSYSTPSSQLTNGINSNSSNNSNSTYPDSLSSQAILGPQHDVELIVQMTKQEDSRFMGKKKRRNSSVSKVFLGDFLKLSSKVSILKMISKYGDNHILFSDVLVKVNKRNKMQERIIIITDKALYNVHPQDYKLKRRISLENVTSLSMSSLEDNFIVIHVNSEYDYVLISNRKIEIATTLVEAYYKLTFYQISPLTPTIQSNNSSPIYTSASPLSISTGTMSNNHNNNSSPSSSPSASPSNMPPISLMSTSYNTVGKSVNNSSTTGGRPQFLRSHSQSQLPPNSNHSPQIPSTIIPPNNLYSPTFTSSNNNIIIINNSNNSYTSNNNNITTNSNAANIVQRITGSILSVDIRDRIEYKTEGDSTRELIFNRIQGAVNTIIQTVKNKTNTNKKDATRVSFR